MNYIRLLCLMFMFSCDLVKAEWNVWTVTDTRHVLRGELPGSERAVSVRAASNEWVSFQILLRSDEPINGIRVQSAELRGPSALQPLSRMTLTNSRAPQVRPGCRMMICPSFRYGAAAAAMSAWAEEGTTT